MQSVMTPRVASPRRPPFRQFLRNACKAGSPGPMDARAIRPAGSQRRSARLASPFEGRHGAAIFFIHPTSAFDTMRWSVPVAEPLSSAQAERFLRMQASAFALSGRCLGAALPPGRVRRLHDRQRASQAERSISLTGM